MALIIAEPFVENKGLFGIMFWGRIPGKETKYICKKLHTPDMSFEIEMEASRRINLPTVYKVVMITDDVIDSKTNKNERKDRWLVSKHVTGSLLFESEMDNSALVNIFVHLFCTLSVMEELNIVHNDLHWGNIIIHPTKRKFVEYKIKGLTYKIAVFGYIPVLIDFGNAAIRDFNVKPNITGFTAGNLGSVIPDTRYDKLKLLKLFSKHLKILELGMDFKLACKQISSRLAKSSTESMGNMWYYFDEVTKGIFPYINCSFTLDVSGMLQTLPCVELPSEYSILEKMEAFLEKTELSTNEFLYEVIKTGSSHPMYHSCCIIATLFGKGIDRFITRMNTDISGVEIGVEFVDLILEKTPNNLYIN